MSGFLVPTTDLQDDEAIDHDATEEFDTYQTPYFEFPRWINSYLDFFRPPYDSSRNKSFIDENHIVFEVYYRKGAGLCKFKGQATEDKLKKFCPESEFKDELAVLIHGMTDRYGYTPKNIMFEKENIAASFESVIFVDWSAHADIYKYIRAIHNRKFIGQMTSQFVLLLHRIKGLKINKVHMMGYSMGAHIMAFAARHIRESLIKMGINDEAENKVQLLTAFDAASPLISRGLFLSKEDASIVQGIHTSFFFGVTTQYGHLDFFPNGGFDQPNCPTSSSSWIDVKEIVRPEVCDHNYSIPVYVDSFKQDDRLCQFVGYPCADYTTFFAGKCYTCAETNTGDCHRLTQRQVKPTKNFGNLYFLSGIYPFVCAPTYHLTLRMRRKNRYVMRSNEGSASQLGWLYNWFRRNKSLKLKLLISPEDRVDKILEIVVKHNYENILNILVAQKIHLDTDQNDYIKPVKFPKIFVEKQSDPDYRVERIELLYMSHSTKEVRDKYSAKYKVTPTGNNLDGTVSELEIEDE